MKANPRHNPLDLAGNILGDAEATRRVAMVKRADKGKLTREDKEWLRENHIIVWERKRGTVYETTESHPDARGCD